ncbi:MAG: group III truncated hemoglobin [Ferruginibacter sp.]
MKKDIENRQDIELLVVKFYEKVRSDAALGHIFNDVAKVNWEKHFPVMFDFWENVLFYTGTYEGNPMLIHQHLHQAYPLTKAHFNRWNELFLETLDENFEGEKSILARQRALSISTMMQIKILSPDNF